MKNLERKSGSANAKKRRKVSLSEGMHIISAITIKNTYPFPGIMSLASIIGFLAAVVGTSLMLPQVIKSIRTKRVKDLSLMMVSFYVLNCILWAWYGYLIWSMPVLVCNLIALAIGVVQYVLKVKYG